MKTLGLVGGTSWHSTIEYYRYINLHVNRHFGDNTNPPLLVYTLNQSQIHQYQIASNWDAIAEMLIKASKSLIAAGAETVLFCANTPHKVYATVKKHIEVPILHIADATSKAILAKGLSKVCFLGTKYTMTEAFILDRFSNHGIEVLTPKDTPVIDELHRMIQKELTYGKIVDSSKTYVLHVINTFLDQGAQGVVLGCTEFPLMINNKDLHVPVFNTTQIHAQAAVNYILQDHL